MGFILKSVKPVLMKLYTLGNSVDVLWCKVMINLRGNRKNTTYLNEADVFSVLPEALATHVDPVFTDQAMSVRAHSAATTSE